MSNSKYERDFEEELQTERGTYYLSEVEHRRVVQKVNEPFFRSLFTDSGNINFNIKKLYFPQDVDKHDVFIPDYTFLSNYGNGMYLVKGDIRFPNCKLEVINIIQQINCTRILPHGLSDSLSNRFGEAYNAYLGRKEDPGRNNWLAEGDYLTPGEYVYNFNSKVKLHLYSLLGQAYHGAPKDLGYGILSDDQEDRLEYFEKAIRKVYEEIIQKKRITEGVRRITWILIPYRIACGLARGNWKGDYFPLLKKLQQEYASLFKEYQILVYIVFDLCHGNARLAYCDTDSHYGKPFTNS